MLAAACARIRAGESPLLIEAVSFYSDIGSYAFDDKMVLYSTDDPCLRCFGSLIRLGLNTFLALYFFKKQYDGDLLSSR